eukprot:479921_1
MIPVKSTCHPFIPSFHIIAISVHTIVTVDITPHVSFSWITFLIQSLYLISSFTKKPESFQEIDGGIIRFILNCYDDIMKAVYHIYDGVHAVHNDLHERNILVDVNDHKCYLIDFEKMFYLSEVYHPTRTNTFKCKTYKCSAAAKHSIETNDIRVHTRDKYLDSGYSGDHIMDGFAKLALFDMKYKVTSVLMHLMLQNSELIGNQSEYVMQLNDKILNETPEDGSMTFWWCTRLELLNYLDVSELESDPVYRQKFVELLQVFESDRKLMNDTSGCV